ncbi:MAG: TIGR03905 family TSCPD domain-containing protein [Eubacteriales bacterium]
MHTFEPQGVCASRIDFEILDGKLQNVRFEDGCPGNLEAISRLLEGMPAQEAMEKLKGIQCQNGTSCMDQLSIAVEEALIKKP